MFVLFIGMLAISRTTSYLTRSLLKVCEPFKLREYLKKEMENDYKYITYPKSKKILHNELSSIDIYGDNTLEKNVEHIFPQFTYKTHPNKAKMRSDLHNLYLCNRKLNNYRQNFKYMDSSDAGEIDNIKILDLKGNEVLSQNEMFKKNGYLMITNRKQKVFIPTNYSRGKISRSLSYFAIKYNYIRELEDIISIKTLVEWNLKDPVDNDEYLKNIIIYKHQGNINPFVIDPDLLQYCFSDKINISEEILSKKRQSSIEPLKTIEYLIEEIRELEKVDIKNKMLIDKFNKTLNHFNNLH
tara:strand:+ start:1615 stop:2508 length:894 start_codon:yes stop_codon:yes gene_type:complete